MSPNEPNANATEAMDSGRRRWWWWWCGGWWVVVVRVQAVKQKDAHGAPTLYASDVLRVIRESEAAVGAPALKGGYCHVPRDLPVQPRRFRPRSPFLGSDWSSGFFLIVRLKSSLVFLLFFGHSGFPPGSPPAVLLRLLHDRTPVCHCVSVYSYVLTRSSTPLPYISPRSTYCTSV